MHRADDTTALLKQIQQSLDATGVWIDPSLSSLFDAGSVATMEANIARSPSPQYVVVYPFTQGDPFNGEPEELLTRLHDASQQDGLYLSARSPDQTDTQSDYASVGLTGRLWGPGPEPYEVTSPADAHHPGDVSSALVEATTAVADGTTEQTWQEYVADDTSTGSSTGSSTSVGQSGGDAVAVGVAIGVVLALVVAVTVWRVRRNSRRTLALPASVVERVREAHDDRLEERAREEVLALGEAIDAADISADDEQSAWQAALDHYDGAGRVLAREGGQPDILDVVGAIVLAGRGQAALVAANSGKAFTPEPTCYLNPLHGRPRGTSTVESGGRRIAVPLCAACQADLRKKRTPDVLDVIRRGRPVHYFEAGDEPWASTGYGTLKPDLVARLQGKK